MHYNDNSVRMHYVNSRWDIVETKNKRFVGTKYFNIYTFIFDVARYEKIVISYLEEYALLAI
jgi:hypothetical protein